MLLLDECVTPAGVQVGWSFAPPIDIIHVNHRGRKAESDHGVWAYANAQGRAIVTINAIDYVRLACRPNNSHRGLFLMEPGHPRAQQLECITSICRFVNSENAASRCLDDRVFCVTRIEVAEVDVANRNAIESILGVNLGA